jgi:uncharacterized protein YggE
MRSLILAALIIPALLQAQQPVRDSVISVSANRSTSVVPDRASAFIIVEGSGETPADANTRLDTKLKAVVDAVRGLGSTASVERPVSYGVTMAQNPQGYPMPAVPTTYVSRSVVRLHIAKIDQLAAAVATILGAGATNVTSLQFESSTFDAVRREKMAEVLALARGDAEAIAAALGGKLGALVDVSSASSPINAFGPGSQLSFDQRYSGGSVQPPLITVNANATVRFRLVR